MDNLLQDPKLLTIIIETFLLLSVGIMFLIQYSNQKKIKKGLSENISKDKYDSVISENRKWQIAYSNLKKQAESTHKEYQVLQTKYNRIKGQIGYGVISEKYTFEDKKAPESSFNNSQEKAEIPNIESVQEQKDLKQNISEGMIMYASFPRSAGTQRYFSDLHENRTDDSFFEFKINEIQGKATFKPLDFMKIRSIDESMIAIETEGAKPNVAASVIGIEPGSAHLEGKDWIIEKQAKIKLV